MAEVAYVVRWFPKLSETFVVDELRALASHGVHPLVFARARPDEPVTNPRADALVERAEWLEDRNRARRLGAALSTIARHPVRAVRATRTALAARSRWSLIDLFHALVLARELDRHDVGYLHAHFADDAAEMAMLASELTGVPFGLTAHGVDIYLGRMLCTKLARASLVVTVCDYNADQLQERCPALDRDEIVLKPAGVDPSSFVPRSSPRRGEGPEVLAVGRLTAKKGFDSLIRAVAELRDRGRAVSCTIVGEGEQRARLQTLIDELGLSPTVQLAGPKSPTEVAELLASATMLVAPCTLTSWGDRDSMPVVLKEAMAMEIPVVATRDFGIPELVTDDVGILVPRDDDEALASAVAHILDLPSEDRAVMGRAGRRRILEHFDEAELVEILIPHFERLAAR